MWKQKSRKDTKTLDDDVNLLLLGETGVGKSTLVNSISNYFNYSSFKKARKGKIDILIPVCLNINDESKIFGKPDDNELHEEGKSATQNVKVYLFPVKMQNRKFNLRLIDTPGVGDPRGIEQDNVHLDNILAYLATLKKLHGICFVLKSNQTRFTKFIEYCLKQILTRLDKSASQNIIFITTYSKISGYTAENTKNQCLLPLVRSVMSRPPHVEIPLSDENVFAVENEAFSGLLGIQEGRQYDKHEMKSMKHSWKKSSKEIRRLFKYIIGGAKNAALKPHDVENTISINNVRFLVEQLTTPIAEVSGLIQDNIRLIDRHREKLTQKDQSLEELKEQLYIPCINFEVKKLPQPVTVCMNCAEVVKVNGVTQLHYKQRCHNPCHLTGIPKEMIADPRIRSCYAMDKDICKKCGCHWRAHLHIYKETQKVEVKKEDQNVKNAIKNKKDARVEIEIVMKYLNTRKVELEEESKTISKIVAQFSYFLQEHALTPFNDAYKDYIEQLIKNEKQLEKFADQQVITELEKLLSRHQHMQEAFQESEKKFQTGAVIKNLTPEGIQKSISKLYNLKHMGPTIQELIHKSVSCRNKETRENFTVVVGQKINLDKETVEEEQHQKVEYSRDDYDLNRTSGSDYDEPRARELRTSRNNHHSGRTSPERRRHLGQHSRDADGHGAVKQRRSESGAKASSSKRDKNLPKSNPSRLSRNVEEDHHRKSEKKPHREHLKVDPSPRRRRRDSDYDSNDRDLKQASRKVDFESDTESDDSYDNQSDGSLGSENSVESPKQTRRSRSVEEDHHRKSEKKSHREHHKVDPSPRRRRLDSDYDSDDRDLRQSSRKADFKSDTESDDSHDNQSDGSLGSENSVDSSKQTGSKSYKINDSDDDRPKKTNRAKNNSSRQARDVEYDDTTTGTKSRNKTNKKLEDSSRQRRHRSDSYDSDDHDHRKSSRKGHTTKSKDKSSSAKHHSDDDHSTKNPVKQSKNPKKSKSANKNHDSDADRPTQSAKTGRNVPKADSETRDYKSSTRSSRSKHAKPADSKTPTKSSPVDKSNERDTYDTKPSRKDRGTKEREFESQKNPKSEEKLSDSSSSDELLDTKPEKQNESKFGSSQNAKRYEVSSTSTSSDSSSSSEIYTVEAKNSESSESDSESYEGTESGSDFENVLY